MSWRVKWSVVIPSAKTDNLYRSTWAAANMNGMHLDEFVVVDDGASDLMTDSVKSHFRLIPGPKPFVYARNINLGVAACAPNDTIIMGDDVIAKTLCPFDEMHETCERHPEIACLSAGIIGESFRRSQRHDRQPAFHYEDSCLAFVCVYIPRWAWEKVGPLDERFIGYGWEDVDWCYRAREMGFKLAVQSDIQVDHSGVITSTFRSKPDYEDLKAYNRKLFVEKWGREP